MRSTPGQLSDFKRSVFWQDCVEELDVWIEEIRNQLENLDLQFDDRALVQLGGCAKALRHVKQLPDVLMAIAEDNEEMRNDIIESLSP